MTLDRLVVVRGAAGGLILAMPAALANVVFADQEPKSQILVNLSFVAVLVDRPEGFTVAEFRDAAASSRKHTLPLLARLDETGVTRRRGDYRIAGPRLPSAG